ncbi:MAG: phosphoribosylglycinamide formyltransferase [Candidatus Riflebacteria bacterium]|nr:phosphoribosylglycinamide formyltransferase [Candidatus Riflebacteria bacterium]
MTGNERVKIAVFISGRGSNMLSIAKSCMSGILANCAEICTVFSDNPASPGIQKASELGLRSFCIPSARLSRVEFETKLIADLETYKPDYIVLAGFRRILTKVFISAYKNRIINIHPADSKAFQGLNGYKWAFENKLPKTFITVHFVDEGVDTGEVLAKQCVDLTGADTLDEVEKRGLAAEHELYPKVLAEFFSRKGNSSSTGKSGV